MHFSKAHRLVATLGLLLVSVAASSQAFNLDSLLVKSVGGEAALERLKTVENISMTGRMLLNGQPGAIDIYVEMPDKVYLGLDFGPFSLAQAYDGRTAWQRDQNGSVGTLSGFEKQELISQTYLATFSYVLPDGLPGEAKYLGEEKIDSVLYHKVAFMPLGQDTVYGYFDVKSGMLVRTVSNLDNLETVTVSDDFESIEGVLMAAHSFTSGTGAPITSEMFADKIVFDADIDSNIFSPPVLLTKDYRFPQGADSVVIPFEYEAGHIYLTAVINGRARLRFILDSGASANIFHLPAIDSLDLEHVGTVAAKGLGGYDQVRLVKTDSIAIGALRMYNQVAGAMAVQGIGRSTDSLPFGGVLGYDFLSRFPLLVDYERKAITVYNPDSFVPPDSGAEVPFHFTMQIPTVEAELNGVKGDYIVDLGNALGVIIHRDFFDRQGLQKKLDDFQPMPGSLRGVGGGVGGRTAYAASFALGDIRISSLRVMIPESSEGVSGSSQLAGNIGNLLLQQFAVLFDYPSQRMVFYDRRTKKEPELRQDRPEEN